MSQISENKRISVEDILKILHSEAQQMPPSQTSSRYLRALQSLTASHTPSIEADTARSANTPYCEAHTLLTNWLVNQWLMQTPFTTASLYLDIISALYGAAVKAGRLPKTTLFSELKAQLKQLGPEGWKSGIDDEIFQRALRLTKNAHLLLLDDAIAADLIILSLNSGLQPLESLALLPRDPSAPSASPSPLRFNTVAADTSLMQSVIARHAANPRRKYLFPLDQSKRTESQLKKHISKIANALFKRTRLPQATDPNQTVEALWAYAALRAGIPAGAIVAHLGHAPLGLPILKLSAGSNATLAPFAPLREIREVGKIFLDNPPRWYALSLRPGVRFTQLSRRIDLLSSNVQRPTSNVELFYPCEEIARAIGRKVVIRQRPFIHSVVFFKAKLTDIGPLFARIGDLAWCYRQSAAPGAPYAEITPAQFRRFQQTIAHFTPDYEVASTGELELRPNDRVEIVGGLFVGHEATFERSEGSRVKSEEGNTIYRLNIVGDNGIEWRIGVDSRLAKQKN